MKLSQYGYDFTPDMLAKYPAENRDEARLMVVNRATGQIEHRIFKDIIDYFEEKDVFVFNDTKVFPARLYGNKDIEKGFIRQHYLKHDKDVIEHLACEKDVVWCIDSYFNREPTHLMMDAVENSVLWEIPRDIMEELSDANGDIAYLYRSFFENSLMLSQLKADILRFESANDRYARLQQHFPEITRRAPLTMIASYLQMTLETLSRVRASIANAESK